MKTVFLSDTHGYHDHVKVPTGDLLIHAGDWMSLDHDLAGAIRFLRWLNQQTHGHKVLIAGNHDLLAEKEPALFRSLLAEYAPTATYLEDSGTEVAGLKLYGSPVTPRFYDWAFNRDRGPAIRAHWDLIPDDTDILITHGPAYSFNDWSPYDRVHAGDEDLLAAIKRVRPKMAVSGHMHHSGGSFKDLVHDDGSKTIVINAAVCDEAYRPTRHPIILHL